MGFGYEGVSPFLKGFSQHFPLWHVVVGQDGELDRRLNVVELTLLGIGACIGAGIFVLTGAEARIAGPSVSWGAKVGKGEIWVFPKIVVPQNGWFMMEIPIKMDDLGVPPFSETSISLDIAPENRVSNHPFFRGHVSFREEYPRTDGFVVNK